jgi:ribonuclease HII
MGIDEAGRGPLAGPVVAAAAYLPLDNIHGICDSKQITRESDREALFEKITTSSNVCWAVAVVTAQRIDEINILQATLEAMTMAATALVTESPDNLVDKATIEQEGCYVIRHKHIGKINDVVKNGAADAADESVQTLILPLASTYALVDGNRLPPLLPVPAEFIIKGDSKEYCIAVASILAKVTRDRLMNAYAVKYPLYNLQQHKGYPTKAHKQLIAKYGPTDIHRMTFAPLKYMVQMETDKADDGTGPG